MGSRNSSFGERGFSLVEMLVALALLGLMAVLLSGAVAQVGLSRQSQSAVEARTDQVQAVQMLLRRRVERLIPQADLRTGSVKVDAFGNAQRFDFTGPAPDRAGPDALTRYSLQRSDRGELVLFQTSSLSARADQRDPQGEGWSRSVLLGQVAALSIQYFGPTEAGTEPVWQEVWSSRGAPPRLVRISLSFAEGDQREWPDLVVRPRSTGISGCLASPQTGLCGYGGGDEG